MNGMKYASTLIALLLLAGALMLGLIACDGPSAATDTAASETTAEVTAAEPGDTPDEETTAAPTEEPTESATEETTEEETHMDPQADMNKLNELMQPIFGGTTVKNETVMFLDKGDVKELLYPISSVTSVTSYDGSKVYVEGVDYVIDTPMMEWRLFPVIWG